MIVKALKKFGDKTTGATYAEQTKILKDHLFECDDELAKERIEKGLVKKATKKEEKTYLESIQPVETIDEETTEEELPVNQTGEEETFVEEETETPNDELAKEVEETEEPTE